MTNEVQTTTNSYTEGAAEDQQGSGLGKAAVTGGILGAVAASVCCVLPLALAVFGVGGHGCLACARSRPFSRISSRSPLEP